MPEGFSLSQLTPVQLGGFLLLAMALVSARLGLRLTVLNFALAFLGGGLLAAPSMERFRAGVWGFDYATKAASSAAGDGPKTQALPPPNPEAPSLRNPGLTAVQMAKSRRIDFLVAAQAR